MDGIHNLLMDIYINLWEKKKWDEKRISECVNDFLCLQLSIRNKYFEELITLRMSKGIVLNEVNRVLVGTWND